MVEIGVKFLILIVVSEIIYRFILRSVYGGGFSRVIGFDFFCYLLGLILGKFLGFILLGYLRFYLF